MTEPTDNELQALWSDAVLPDTVTKRLAFSFVRAVLAKWGTLAPVGVEPFEPAAYLHDDGYWTPARTDEGRKLNDRLLRAGSPKIGVYLSAPTAPSVLEDAARYRHIRDVPHSEEVRSVLIHQQNAVMDKVIDKDRAALAAKKGGTHD